MIKFAVDDSGKALPARAQVGVISAEIAGEGEKVILSDGTQRPWKKKLPPPLIPDWSKIESIAHYFGREGYSVYPAWLYHPKQPKRIVMNADEAMELGICYREATIEEKGRYGVQHVWDWTAECEWRPTQFMVEPFNPANPGLGKNYIPTAPNPMVAQNALIDSLIPKVAMAVAEGLRSSGPGAPADVDPVEWNEFQKFMAWKKTREAVDDLGADAGSSGSPSLAGLLDGLPSDERGQWEKKAADLGIKVDNRWSLETLIARVQKAA